MQDTLIVWRRTGKEHGEDTGFRVNPPEQIASLAYTLVTDLSFVSGYRRRPSLGDLATTTYWGWHGLANQPTLSEDGANIPPVGGLSVVCEQIRNL